MDMMILEKFKEHRPDFHFSAKTGWINDPNGLLYHEGVYHLYYQHYPRGNKHGPMHWGHAVSDNLLDWVEKPIAIYPTAKGVIFSGSAIADYTNASGFGKDSPPIVAAFTLHQETPKEVIQSQGIAYSLDNGDSYTHFADNPVITYDNQDFRDPKVFWHEETKKWVMVVVAGRKAIFYNSADLKSWDIVSEFNAPFSEPTGVWECPDLIKIKVEGTDEYKWALIISVNTQDAKYYGMQYFIGEFDGKVFTSETPNEKVLMIDFGFDNYAAVTFNGIKGRNVLIGWMSCWYYVNEIPATDFRGSMTIPRELVIIKGNGNYIIKQSPIAELYKSFEIKSNMTNQKSGKIQNGTGIINIELPYQSNTVTIKNKKADIKIKIDVEDKTVSIDRRGCGHEEIGEHYFREFRAEFFKADIITLEIILDVTSIELFVNGGEQVGTLQYFTDQPLEEICSEVEMSRIEIREKK